ncbi:2,4-dihydroxyhept-2-ene-1,7-dioic acid aldolase [Haematobacter massiliensis]|uniref:2,4-dihydroxyhept-2-ene-1,7-dioic acid aldolase n=1 Tax=Haematobacter massiliensis TaxID=195105 RepID=A0A086Y6Y5_9RHOB|nr:aldolase/citrate lyase family protein [Haematobacter massiliensis]KFI30035.1 2,4-dihydroxyhept-2-ene-1,7-dioic acid aldolase [Haematobacter massiliensis]OWJ69799.1 2,4-dihydroxyhept-2-ene-1,7-dioic acid aldolase [Haematobacter massiliensis]OWJ82627.1 2,4-dihydroxyhept-2-ene-1,7-dioic acid aldolase [Haematobacter massiliensis]QBJ25540.1 2,4-dihydroxyhept-2-ene-1,7-dioic acid aldolase [Haematobacter massiliensis]
MSSKLKAMVASGQFIRNGWLSLPCAYSAELMARLPWDSLTVDLQHGVQDYQSLVACFQGMAGSKVVPMARVPENAPGIIGKVLDAGAWGVICPMVNTADQARALVDACLYPPQGARSFGPNRAAGYATDVPYHHFANDQLLVLPMIETREALENAEEILAVPGVSGAYIGPSDLGFSLGFGPAFDRDEPELLAAFERVRAAAQAAGKFTGIHTLSAAYANRMRAAGFGLATIGSDGFFMQQGARAALDACPAGG